MEEYSSDDYYNLACPHDVARDLEGYRDKPLETKASYNARKKAARMPP